MIRCIRILNSSLNVFRPWWLHWFWVLALLFLKFSPHLCPSPHRILILNLPTNIYKSTNNYWYQQKTTNLPTIELFQTNICIRENYKSSNNKNVPNKYKGKTTNLTTKNYKSPNNKNVPTNIYKSTNNKLYSTRCHYQSLVSSKKTPPL